jgi:hypothetical protein
MKSLKEELDEVSMLDDRDFRYNREIYEDVKEKVLEFDELLKNEIIFSKFQMTFRERQKRINELRKEFKVIFGDFKE